MKSPGQFKLLLILLLISIAVVTATLRGQEQERIPGKQQKFDKTDFENQFPIADFDSPAAVDLKERDKRQARGKKYDNKEGAIDPYSDSTYLTSDWAKGLPALPASQSDAVIVGDVTDAQGYLSNNKRTVYSEFIIKITDVLKDSNNSLTSGRSIAVERQGGRVRFSSGHVNMVVISGQGMPRIGRRYLLFLKENKEGQDYSIIVGYELREGRVVLLDDAYPGHPIRNYKDAAELNFINDVRAAITNTQTPK